MPAPLDLVGQRFGRLVVVALSDDRRGGRRWHCRCDCGVEKTIVTCALRNGHVNSCGCLRRERATTHGQTKARAGQATREYQTWQALIRRCVDPKNVEFARYGGRGITVCARWRASFDAFIADMGPRPSSRHSIDRRDNDHGYSCGKCGDCASRGEVANCRWATKPEQNRNSSLAVMIEYDGQRLCITDWAATIGITPQSLGARLKRGWPLERAMTEGGAPGARGERSALARLTASAVLEIRAASASGESPVALAARHGVTAANISLIANGRTWKHLLPADAEDR